MSTVTSVQILASVDACFCESSHRILFRVVLILDAQAGYGP